MLAVHILNVGEPNGSSTQCAQIYRTHRNIGHRLQNFWNYGVISSFLVGFFSTLVEDLRCVDHSTHLSYWVWKYSPLVRSCTGQNGMPNLRPKINTNRRIRITERKGKKRNRRKRQKNITSVYTVKGGKVTFNYSQFLCFPWNIPPPWITATITEGSCWKSYALPKFPSLCTYTFINNLRLLNLAEA